MIRGFFIGSSGILVVNDTFTLILTFLPLTPRPALRPGKDGRRTRDAAGSIDE